MKTAGGGDDDDNDGGGGGDYDDDVAVYRNRPLCTSWPFWHWTVRTAGGGGGGDDDDECGNLPLCMS